MDDNNERGALCADGHRQGASAPRQQTNTGKVPFRRSARGRRFRRIVAAKTDSLVGTQSRLRFCPSSTAPERTHQRSRVGASIRRSVPVRGNRRTPHQRHLALTPVGRSGPGPGGRLPSHNVGLFRCSREPYVSLPRRSRVRRPHTCQTASRATLHSLRSFRALWHWKTQSRVPASKRVCKPATSPARTVPPLRLPAP